VVALCFYNNSGLPEGVNKTYGHARLRRASLFFLGIPGIAVGACDDSNPIFLVYYTFCTSDMLKDIIQPAV
jgi:hypothetical protein